MTLNVNVSEHRLYCLVGRNGVGKTTLVRAMRNISNADTFLKTAPPRIFSRDSSISYQIDGTQILFEYDPVLKSLNCRQEIPADIRASISAELPIPHGDRFNFAKTASVADEEIRRRVVLGNYAKPTELINFLSSIYESEKYSGLMEVTVKGKKYYAIVNSDGFYIREDYLSSGEHFLINLYRTIKSNAKLIVIDEIDLSLDAAAQAKIAVWLRSFCQNYGCSIMFTTHSLAVMRTLEPLELTYLDNNDSAITTTPASYSYVKARLFGFQGWDRYILTEDQVLCGFIEFLLTYYCQASFFSWKVIHIGGATQVVDLLTRNATDEFLASQNEVIAVLDGDQRATAHALVASVTLLPIESVEKDLYERRTSDGAFPFQGPRTTFTGNKDFFAYLQQAGIATRADIYRYLVESNRAGFDPLIEALTTFLARPSS